GFPGMYSPGPREQPGASVPFLRCKADLAGRLGQQGQGSLAPLQFTVQRGEYRPPPPPPADRRGSRWPSLTWIGTSSIANSRYTTSIGSPRRRNRPFERASSPRWPTTVGNPWSAQRAAWPYNAAFMPAKVWGLPTRATTG